MKIKAPSRDGFMRQSFSDTSMKVGTIIAAYSPSDKGNFSQSVWEYDVAAMTSRGMESATTTIYRNCHMQSYFGGIADKCLWTPNVQVNEKDASGNPTAKITSPGTTVLIECVQGITFYGVIVGAVQPEGAGPETEDFGDGSGGMVPTYAWQYNGVRVDINKDGEVTITRKGPTKPDGSFVNGPSSTPPADGFTTTNTTSNDSAANASIFFDKDGNVTAQTGDGKNIITLDVKNGKISITADKEIDIKAGSKVVIDCGEIDLTANPADAVALAQKQLTEIQKITNYLTAINAIMTGPPIPETGMGSPSAFQTAIGAAANAVGGAPTVNSAASDKVKAG
jgi:hypothetical protein